MGRAAREGRLDDAGLAEANRRIEELTGAMSVMVVDASLAWRAGHLAQTQHLRGADAVHLAAAEAGGERVTLVAGDAALGAAARRIGLAVAEI